VGAAIAFVISVFQFLSIRKRESREREFNQYHLLIEHLVSPDEKGSVFLDRQIAIVFELRHFPRYYECTQGILTGLKQSWSGRQEHSRLISEIDLTLEYIRKSRFVLRSLLWGGACGLVLAGGLTGAFFYEQQPKPWNTHALRATNVKAEPLSKLNNKLEEESSGIWFTADVENTTGIDMTLPQTETIMGQTKGSHALHGSFLKLNHDYFLPARHVTSVSLSSDDLCAANYAPQSCFDSYFKDDEDTVIFDESHKYELHIRIPALTLPPQNQTTVSPPSKQ